MINAHNALYDSGQSSYFLNTNKYSALTFEEFGSSFSGGGKIGQGVETSAGGETPGNC